MKAYQTLSGDKNFLSEIQKDSWKGTVHSSFQRTVNIICSTGGLYTIATAELDNAPNTLRVSRFFNEKKFIPIHTPVVAEKGTLYIEKIACIETKRANCWQYPQVVFPKKIDYLRILKRLEKINEWLKVLDQQGGYLLNKQLATSYEKMVHIMLVKESSQMMLSLRNRQLFQAMEQLQKIAGLGPGLTPSGDDFLVGLALIFSTIDYPYHSLKQWLMNNREILKERTNDISFSTLDWAMRGAGRERIGDFLTELFYGDDDEVLKEKMLEVFAIGSTSGGDMLAGMLAGIQLTIDLQAS